MIKLRKVHRRGAQHAVWTEVHPQRCPGCREPYRGGHVAVGWLSCGCVTDGTGGHRTLFCRDCGFELFLPPHLGAHGPPAP